MGSSTSTRNFGMRRFTNLVREARYRAPATALRLGTLVEIDPASTTDPKVIRQAAGGAGGSALGGGGIIKFCGILLYEHDAQTFVGQASSILAQDHDFAEPGRMVQVLHGPGTKIWLRNTAADTPEPGLNFPSARDEVIMVANLGFHGTGDIAVDDLLAWDSGNLRWAKTAVFAEAFLRVTHVNNDDAVSSLDAEFLV